ncbi:MAG: hypothetical protein WDN01_16025 [Rhizomicrobium sp.]
MRVRTVSAALCAAILLTAPPAFAADAGLRKAGNIINIALPVSAAGVALLHRDWKGFGEFAVAAGLTVGTTYALNQIVRIRRPDHSDFHSFAPPDLALADSSADFLWDRYGWQYGMPAYAARFVSSYALTDNKKNHWYDTLASAAVAYGFNYAIVTRYRPQRYRLSVEPEPNGASLHFVMQF